MIDAAVRILDKLIELLKDKERRKELHFKEFIEPIFKDAEEVAKDYIKLFKDLIERLRHEDDIPKVIEWIEKRREIFLPLRIKMRGVLKTYFPNTENMDKFQNGLWWLLKGGLTFIHEGRASFIDGNQMGSHTVLDLLYQFSQKPLKGNREEFIIYAQRQLDCIEKAWLEVCEGYTELKMKAI